MFYEKKMSVFICLICGCFYLILTYLKLLKACLVVLLDSSVFQMRF